MIKNSDFVVFSDDWARTPSSTQHLFRVLSSLNRVFWFNTIGLRSIQMRKYDLWRAFEKIISWFKIFPKTDASPNIFTFNPFMLPTFFPKIARKINKKILLFHIKRVIKKFNLTEIIFFTTIPTVCDLVGIVGEKKSIYFCVDEYSKWPDVRINSFVKEMEFELLNKVDFLFCPCKELLNLKKKEGFSGFLLSHGVDVKHFTNYKTSPSDLKPIPCPRIGFIGSLDNRIDFGLVEYLCLERPSWSFVFGGKRVALPIRLLHLPNFFYIGDIEYDKLPAYLHSFDICLMPYKSGDVNQYLAPLKLKEILLCGKAIVSSALPNTFEYSSFLKIAKNCEDFLSIMEAILNTPDPYICAKESLRIENINNLLAHETWEEKAEIFSSVIESALSAAAPSLVF